jgi:hypothetical protein
MGGPLGENRAPVGAAMMTFEDDVFLVGGIALEEPSAVVLVSASWSSCGWICGGVQVVIAGRCS